MTSILSVVILTGLIIFGISIQNRSEILLKDSVQPLELDLKDGSICGRDKTGVWFCDNIYVFKINKGEK